MMDRMHKFVITLQNLLSDEQGQDMVEYALVIALIATACVASTSSFAQLLLTSYNSLAVAFGNYV